MIYSDLLNYQTVIKINAEMNVAPEQEEKQSQKQQVQQQLQQPPRRTTIEKGGKRDGIKIKLFILETSLFINFRCVICCR